MHEAYSDHSRIGGVYEYIGQVTEAKLPDSGTFIHTLVAAVIPTAVQSLAVTINATWEVDT